MRSVFRTSPATGVILLLLLFVAVWTAYPAFTRLNLDKYGDMLENYSWGIAWQAGYFKHPPLFAWITAGWFSLFPNADWAYYLLSAANAALAILASWRIALRFLDPWRAFLSVALFFFLPPFTFLATKYNANAAMLPLWPLTVLLYLRLLERRKMLDAVLLGAVAAAGMLAKYYSAVLLAAIALHLVADREARPMLRQAVAWVACAVFLLLLVPHAVWLFQNDFLPVTYAAHQGHGSWLDALLTVPRFLVAVLLYALPATGVIGLALWRNGATRLVEPGWVRRLRQGVKGRALLWATFGPLALAVFLGTVFSADLSSVWALPMFYSVPILLLLSAPQGQLERRRGVIPAIAVGFCLVLMAAVPAVRWFDRADEVYHRVPVRRIAQEVERAWAAHTDAPLAIVAGDKILASGASFYGPSRPLSMQGSSFALTPWVKPEDVARKGILVACFKERGLKACEAAAQRLRPAYDAQVDVTVHGFAPGEEWPVRFFIALPRAQTAG